MLRANVLATLAAIALPFSVIACELPRAGEHVAVASAGEAVGIARAAWAKRFPPEQVSKYEPYRAELKAGVWEVSGHLPANKLGGTPMASICQVTGVVQKVAHGQ